jgi:hypothetical protein
MDSLIKLVEVLAWPLTVLIIVFYFRKFLKEFLQIVTSRLTKTRIITAKMGAFELNMQQMCPLCLCGENDFTPTPTPSAEP